MGAKGKKEFIQNRQRERSIVTMAPIVAAEISSGSDLYMSILYINKRKTIHNQKRKKGKDY